MTNPLTNPLTSGLGLYIYKYKSLDPLDHCATRPVPFPPSVRPKHCVGTAPHTAPPKLAKPKANNSLMAMTSQSCSRCMAPPENLPYAHQGFLCKPVVDRVHVSQTSRGKTPETKRPSDHSESVQRDIFGRIRHFSTCRDQHEEYCISASYPVRICTDHSLGGRD